MSTIQHSTVGVHTHDMTIGVYGAGMLVQAILNDLEASGGTFFPADAVELALELPCHEVGRHKYMLELILSKECGAATRNAIVQASQQTAMYHFLKRSDTHHLVAERYARSGDTSTVIADEIISGILSRGGFMDDAVDEVFRRRFDPSSFTQCSLEDLKTFFWESFNVKYGEIQSLHG